MGIWKFGHGHGQVILRRAEQEITTEQEILNATPGRDKIRHKR